MNRYFFTGAPGSRWSGIAQIIEEAGNFNITDRNAARDYSHSTFTGHKGMYFGNAMVCDAVLDGPTLDRYFNGDGPRLIKSHDWAYILPNVKNFCVKNNDRLILVYRHSQTCFDWWVAAGGFSISYPNYSWYENEKKMFLEIVRQNKAILDFCDVNNLALCTFNKQWIKANFGSFIDFEESTFKDVSVAIL